MKDIKQYYTKTERDNLTIFKFKLPVYKMGDKTISQNISFTVDYKDSVISVFSKTPFTKDNHKVIQQFLTTYRYEDFKIIKHEKMDIDVFNSVVSEKYINLFSKAEADAQFLAAIRRIEDAYAL